MSRYKIKVNVEIVESDESEVNNPTIEEDGSFTMILNESDAVNIDKCENALLRTSYGSIREAISHHFTEISKKKPLNKRRVDN